MVYDAEDAASSQNFLDSNRSKDALCFLGKSGFTVFTLKFFLRDTRSLKGIVFFSVLVFKRHEFLHFVVNSTSPSLTCVVPTATSVSADVADEND